MTSKFNFKAQKTRQKKNTSKKNVKNPIPSKSFQISNQNQHITSQFNFSAQKHFKIKKIQSHLNYLKLVIRINTLQHNSTVQQKKNTSKKKFFTQKRKKNDLNLLVKRSPAQKLPRQRKKVHFLDTALPQDHPSPPLFFKDIALSLPHQTLTPTTTSNLQPTSENRLAVDGR